MLYYKTESDGICGREGTISSFAPKYGQKPHTGTHAPSPVAVPAQGDTLTAVPPSPTRPTAGNIVVKSCKVQHVNCEIHF